MRRHDRLVFLPKRGVLIMNGYKAFYKSNVIDVYAYTSLQAQQLAAAQFKAKKAYEVTVMLCEKAGAPVIHTSID